MRLALLATVIESRWGSLMPIMASKAAPRTVCFNLPLLPLSDAILLLLSLRPDALEALTDPSAWEEALEIIEAAYKDLQDDEGSVAFLCGFAFLFFFFFFFFCVCLCVYAEMIGKR